MVISLVLQAQILIFSIASGIIAGMIIDFYKGFRWRDTTPRVIVFIKDVLFAILMALNMFIYMIYTNNAIIRVYVLLCVILGYYLYSIFLRKVYMVILNSTLRGVQKLLRIAFKNVSYPIRFIIYRISLKNKGKNRRNNLNKV